MTAGRTGLEEDAYKVALRQVREYLRREPYVKNASFRALTGLNYDQGIKFFNRALADGCLQRRGKASGTHYTLPEDAG
jgi:hypothetical protein